MFPSLLGCDRLVSRAKAIEQSYADNLSDDILWEYLYLLSCYHRQAHIVDKENESEPLEDLIETEIPQPLLVVPSPVPSIDELHSIVGHAHTPATVDTKSEPEEAPSVIEEFLPLVSRAPLTNEEFEASEPSDTRIISSHSTTSSDSTTPLSPDPPLTQTAPTPTLSLPLYYRRTTHMAVRTQPTLSPGFLARLTEAMTLSLSSFRKRYRSSYETPSSSSSPAPSPTLLIRKRHLGLGYEAARRRALELVEEIAPSTFEVGQGSRSVPDQQVADETPTSRILVCTTWIDPEDGTVYLDIEIDPRSCAPVQTPSSPEWSSGSLPISPAFLTVPSPIASPVTTPAATIAVDEDEFLDVGTQLELHEIILHDHTQRLDALPPALFEVSTASTYVSTGSRVSTVSISLDLSRLATTVNKLERSIQIGINKWYQSLLRNSKVLPPKTAKEILARERERKARTNLLMSIPEDHLENFHKMTDAKEMWEAIKSRFGGSDESKKMQVNLRFMAQASPLKMPIRSSLGLYLLPGPKVFEPDVKDSTGSSSSVQNVAFVSSSTSSTNDSSGPQLDHEDLERVDEFDLEEMDLKWQVAMISMRLKKFYKTTWRKLQFDAKKPVCFDKTKEEPKALVTLDGDGVDWIGHAEDEQENFALMAYSNSSSNTEVTSCLKECEESYAKLKKLYDDQREQLWFMKIDLDDKTNLLTYHKKLLAEAVKEKEELKTKLENFQSSSKGLSKLLNSQMCAKDKSGLGYGDQIHEGVLSYENEVLESVFNSRSSDVEDSLVYDRFAKVEGMHVVPPPMTGIYMPPKSDFGIDESNFTYGPKQSKTSESAANTSDSVSCESNSSVETLESVPKPAVNEPKAVSKPKVWSDAPIIEEYESDSDDEYVIKPSKEQEKPSFAFVNTVKHVKTPRETVKEQNTCSPSPKADKRDWNGLMSKKLGLGYGFTKKACFKSKGTGQGKNRPVWNNMQRLNHQNKFVPKAVLTKTGRFPVNATKQNLFSQATTTSTARKVNTARPIVNEIRPRNNFYKSHSFIRRPFNRTTTPKANFTNHKVNIVVDKIVSAVRGNRETAVKASAGCNWGSKRHYWNNDDPHKALKNKGIVDSGCSRHMTRNKAYLVEYQDYNGGPVAFGGCKGQITGKGKILTGKLDFEDVYFVKELKQFNLFSLSQICDKKNKVLLTDFECLVLSPNFKLPDENQVLLRVPRQNNMYSFNLENIVPAGDEIKKLVSHVTSENKANKTAGPKEANHSAGTQDNIDAGNSEMEAEPAQEYFILPLWSSYTSTVKSSEAKNGGEKPNGDTGSKTNEEPLDQAFLEELKRLKRQEKEANDAAEAFRKEFAQCTEDLLLQAGAARATSTNTVNTVSTPVSTASPSRVFSAGGPSYPNLTNNDQDDSQIPALIDIYDNPSNGILPMHLMTMRIKPKKISQTLEDESWVDAMQEEMLQFKIQKVWILVDLPFGKKEIKTKWVYKNKKDERGVVVRNKARLVAQVVKGSREDDCMLVQVYVDDIIFSSTKKSWCDEFEAFMKSRFHMSSIGELTFFLGLQVKQKEDGIFISQDKYVAEILKKFDFASVKTASTPIETQKPLINDEEVLDVDVHLYRSMIDSLMYLTASRLDIMFAVCACSRFQETLKTSHLHAVKRIFRYLKGKPKLGLWYPRVSSFDLEAYSDSDYNGTQIIDRKLHNSRLSILG
ncbi:ribonuclease H-like domain-containing protein [Tanacetum coccineum]|uniref:Ribonuclease H-like domain-containing protein n=1 Tax=Tanacetum coccineum TaxID=301880 RepID=A0ABQ5D6J4_9ASTR